MNRNSFATIGRMPKCLAAVNLRWHWAVVLLAVVPFAGCGTTKARTATEQILASDAVDRSVANIDFGVLAGKKVYLDTKYISPVKPVGFVNTNYIISSMRQQMAAAECLLQDTPAEADYIVEPRIGTLGSDGHEVVYGIPASSALTTASSLVPNAPPIPPLPEISLAKRIDYQAAAKIAVFAYDRKTKYPVWQSGISQVRSTSKDTWLLGAGPFQRGTIYEGTQFAGDKIGLAALIPGQDKEAPIDVYSRQVHFVLPPEAESESKVIVAGHEEPAGKEKGAGKGAATSTPPATPAAKRAAKPPVKPPIAAASPPAAASKSAAAPQAANNPPPVKRPLAEPARLRR